MEDRVINPSIGALTFGSTALCGEDFVTAGYEEPFLLDYTFPFFQNEKNAITDLGVALLCNRFSGHNFYHPVVLEYCGGGGGVAPVVFTTLYFPRLSPWQGCTIPNYLGRNWKNMEIFQTFLIFTNVFNARKSLRTLPRRQCLLVHICCRQITCTKLLSGYFLTSWSTWAPT